jgi:hypothetical protein
MPLDSFDPLVQKWFQARFASVTEPQRLDVTRLSEVIPMAEDVTGGLGALRSGGRRAGKK